ncbi:hypothetical protein Trydic_g8403 [Trypoxylus dichotomus]
MPRFLGQRDINPEHKEKLIALLERNVPIADIAEELNLSISQVYRWKRRFAEDGDPFASERKGRCGRKRSLNENLLQLIENEPFSCTSTIWGRLHLNCTRQTVWKTLRRRSYRCRRPAHKIELTAGHVAAKSRLDFARANLDRNWQAIIFCVEKVFSTDIGSRKPLYKLPNTRYEERNV